MANYHDFCIVTNHQDEKEERRPTRNTQFPKRA